ncbi:S-(hydroxymethyl)glutathione dehydrogenase [Burkholderia pseudomallei]|nr:S-(hydroxymethyl)glutathione dehydrogenase [Burkholderia pseudomallei]ARL02275.1 S-(hydroxymethyl)glutathione dehydrogenase [Burkholderia pseudomallei]ARL45070.1 S-(hydroxymethyl)glutathione dehydrogenase [Burkholderia pseudomallei]MBG1249460.1 S-(hydroxymethyl)glutathione dehydrogenase [Burkholderia pseudomallei]OSP94623.1 S-(hydroxymethyl)glutathione dehydrogenase [Burkholderia pseudomallei]
MFEMPRLRVGISIDSRTGCLAQPRVSDPGHSCRGLSARSHRFRHVGMPPPSLADALAKP